MFTLTAGSLMHIAVDKDLQKLIFVYGRVFRPNLRYRQGSTNSISCLENKRWGAEVGIILSICCCSILVLYSYFRDDDPLNNRPEFFVLVLTFGIIAMFCWCFVLWKNVSVHILRKLFRQSSFVLVVFMCSYRIFIAFAREDLVVLFEINSQFLESVIIISLNLSVYLLFIFFVIVELFPNICNFIIFILK